jgi:hypothetical protein
MSSYTSKVIAVFGRTVRAGRWKVAEDSLVIAFFGRCVLDLTRAYVDEDDDDLTVSVFSLFGSVSILLPPGCDVEPSGVSIAASSEIEIPSDKPVDITNEVLAPFDISWFALFAKVRIVEAQPELVAPTVAALHLGVRSGSPGTEQPALEPPAVEVFGTADEEATDDGSGIDESPEVESVDIITDTTPDPEAEAARLRDEIAQWRAESAKESTPAVDPASEIIG